MTVLTGSVSAELRIDADFPGGSVEVREILPEEQRIVVDPADHAGKGWRCWWYFRIEGLRAGQPATIEVGNAPWATPDRAHFSFDRRTWIQTEPGLREGRRIAYTLPPAADGSKPVWVAWGPPFVPADARALVERVADDSPDATAWNLCDTKEGRPVPALRFASAHAKEAPGQRQLVWIQARQHAWESGSSWVAKGLIEWLASDAHRAKILRERAEIVVVPVMDIDNVHRGAGGKNQKPQDHNRDWSDEPHWNAVKAAQRHLREADEADRLALFVDLHNPSAGARQPFFFVPPAESLTSLDSARLQTFLDSAQQEIVGPLRFSGRVVESGSGYDPKAWTRISKNWVAANSREGVVAVTLETAWNTKASTPTGYKTVGHQLGKTILRFLTTHP